LPFYYGWVNVVLAAMAMLATLPGRTQGLGLVTEPLLADLNLNRDVYAQLNLWATLLGALCCLPVGQLLDRFGSRRALAVIVAALALTVWSMSAVTSAGVLFLLLTLTRGLGQSALSVVSIALVGKWFPHRISLAMGLYAVLVGLFFATAFVLVGWSVGQLGWRVAWRNIAIALAVFLPMAWLLVRSTPESCGLLPDAGPGDESASLSGLYLHEALRTPAFWVFALATAVYGLVVSGVGLFNEAILAELGFDQKTYYQTLGLSTLVGLASQLLSGWIGWKWSLPRLMSLAMGLYAASLLWLPHVTTLTQLWGNAFLMGAAGGMITVVFFAIWADAFGRVHLGRIQGAAQMLTVVSSAVGPILFAECELRTGSYSLVFHTLAPIVLALGVAAWHVPLPVNAKTRLREALATG
ncbi:MAG TPA: MFS transporter, partial [Pirellulales bacterium]